MLFWLQLSLAGLYAQASPPSLQEQVEQHLMRFEFEKAKKLVANFQQPGYAAYYRINIHTYRYLAGMQEADAQSIRRIWDEEIKAIEGISMESPLRNVLLSEVYCKRSIVEFLGKNYLTAIRMARLGRRFALQNQKRFADNPEQEKVLGIFNILLSAIPKKYHWVTETLGYKGDQTQGMAQLVHASAEGTLLPFESELLICFIEKNMLDQTDLALKRMEELRKTQGDVLLLDYVLASGYMSVKQNDQALAVLNRRNLYQSPDIFFPPFWDFQMGKAYLFKNDLRNAQRYFAKFLKEYPGDLFRSDAQFRLGMALTLGGSYAVGKHFFISLANDKDSGFDEDEYARFMAQKFASRPPTANELALQKARNMYDGGYYEDALALLAPLQAEKASLPDEIQVELAYRQGRIYHSQGKLPASIASYQDCLRYTVAREHIWLQAYARYFLADMAHKRGDLPAAKAGYQKALAYDDYFYQAGLENRCKAALNKLRKEQG